MAKKLFIDLNKCDSCETCGVECAYFYRAQPADHGLLTLRELATFALVCRRCEEPDCVAACRFEALERQDDGVLKRYNLRCVSCKCCSHACPFGTIFFDKPSGTAAKCDLCAGDPACAHACPTGAIAFETVEPGAWLGDFGAGVDADYRRALTGEGG